MDESRIFLDTAYAIALASRTDEHHQRAAALAAEMEREATRLVTTRAILVEIGNALAKIQYRQAAVGLLVALEQDASIEIIPLTNSLYERALGLYRQRSDKDWGMTDCISFVVMEEKGLRIHGPLAHERRAVPGWQRHHGRGNGRDGTLPPDVPGALIRQGSSQVLPPTHSRCIAAML